MSGALHTRSSRLRLGVVVSGWPRVSETFAINELLALESAGVLAVMAATKPGDLELIQPTAQRLATPVHLLDGDESDQIAALTELARGRVDAMHGYFAHRPTTVARGVARNLGVPFGFSAHALDVRKVEPNELALRCAEARAVISCNDDTANVLAEAGGRVLRLAHGVDTSTFPLTPLRSDRSPVELLAVGRLVAKKGFPTLIEALAKVSADVRLRIVGDGPQRDDICAAMTRFGVTDRVELVGRVTHEQLPAMFASSDIVIVPSVVDSAGDRDGLPNVVLEAMASGRPVIASDVAAIATAVRHGDTGLLVPPNDAAALADAINQLTDSPAKRARIALSARSMVEQEFELSTCTTRLIHALETAYV